VLHKIILLLCKIGDRYLYLPPILKAILYNSYY
jgi:hypothetical protein